MNSLESNLEFEALLNYLKQSHGCDLTGYKRTTLMRRFRHRMQQLGIENYGSYLQYLQDHPEECAPLLETIWINYSGFFRDPDSWNYLADKVIPQIIASKQSQEQIRVWSPGCASGQEVYTLAILLAEALGSEQYLQRVQIFATDIDEDALQQARQASYSDREIVGIPSGLRSKYMQHEQHHVFHSHLRRTIIFGRHDLAENAPMSKIDLLVCRNVLMYFTPQIQATILVRFHFALTAQGFLFLGNAESLTNHGHLFIPVNLKHRIFAKGENLTLKDHLLIQPHRHKKPVDLTTQSYFWQAAFETSPFAQLAVDRRGHLLMANKQAYTLFGLQSDDLGTRVQELAVGQFVDLWALIRQLNRDVQSTNFPEGSVNGHHRTLSLKNVKWVTDHGTTYLDIHIVPISDPSGKLLGANLSFIDISRNVRLEDIERLDSTLANQDLHDTKEVLDANGMEH